jgi:UDP-N-acetyl-D-mannosaminuronic acid transferase (WecB/TagA/CpsF family)
MMHRRLVEPRSSRAASVQVATYTQALLASDLLLPDGIALQWFARGHTGHTYANLNGTDFLPALLDELTTQ